VNRCVLWSRSVVCGAPVWKRERTRAPFPFSRHDRVIIIFLSSFFCERMGMEMQNLGGDGGVPGSDGGAASARSLLTEADVAFFKSMIHRDNPSAPRKPEHRDFDVYLMETGLMPLLLQGLGALAKHVDQMGHKQFQQSSSDHDAQKSRFNPRIWLAQYILRNHPGHVRAGGDSETREDIPNYAAFSEAALIEKGRRELLRRRPQIENLWQSMERKTQGQFLNVNHMPLFVDLLDDQWNLKGGLRSKLPKHFMHALGKSSGTDEVHFLEFWKYFEKLFEEGDLLRVEDFERGAMLKKEEDLRLEREAEERERKEQISRAREERRAALVAQFETVRADLASDTEALRILNNGAVLSGVEDEENAVSLSGEHVQWIKQMIKLWGVDMAQAGGAGVWNDQALAAWKSWAKRYSPHGEAGKVDAGNLEILMSLESYSELFLAKAFPTEAEAAASGWQAEKTLGIRRVEDRGVEYIAQVVDDETGQVIEVSLPDALAEEVTRRLATERGPIMVSVNLEDNCVGQLV